jgi:hypothetical protein
MTLSDIQDKEWDIPDVAAPFAAEPAVWLFSLSRLAVGFHKIGSRPR